MRMALIRDGLVVNVIEAEPGFAPQDGAEAVETQSAAPGWIYAGGAFRPPPPAKAPAPAAVTMFQAREALRRTPASGGGVLLDAVNAYVEARRDSDPTLSLAWEYATHVERGGRFVTSLAGAFGLDEAALDDLFRLAATIAA